MTMGRSWWLGVLAGVACGGGDVAPGTTTIGTTTTGASGDVTGTPGTGSTSTSDPGGTADTTTGEPAGPWEPGGVYPTPPGPNARGFLDRRGIIHAHSVYSHDACDGAPMDAEGNVDQECYEDLRGDMCLTQHDFIMLTDHREFFSDTEFPDTLLYDEARGDVLVDHDGPAANWAACGDDRAILVMAGCEAGLMSVGLQRHATGRGETYGAQTVESKGLLEDAGAVVLLAHPEDYTPEQLEALPVSGFEMYNLHANTIASILEAAQLVTMVMQNDPGLPHPDLVIFPLWAEDPRYLERWGTVLARGGRPITTMGTDSHRNTFPEELPDGERVDSFRRMQQWFSNHLLVVPDGDGGYDDLAIKDALRARRLYGVFEYMGYPEGFDARIESEAGVVEIGGEVSLADAPAIVVAVPQVQMLDPAAEAPVITGHVMRAIEGGFEEVADGTDELLYAPDAPGAYRVEVRITPRHLVAYLGNYVDLADTPRVWIYANAFFVGA